MFLRLISSPCACRMGIRLSFRAAVSPCPSPRVIPAFAHGCPGKCSCRRPGARPGHGSDRALTNREFFLCAIYFSSTTLGARIISARAPALRQDDDLIYFPGHQCAFAGTGARGDVLTGHNRQARNSTRRRIERKIPRPNIRDAGYSSLNRIKNPHGHSPAQGATIWPGRSGGNKALLRLESDNVG